MFPRGSVKQLKDMGNAAPNKKMGNYLKLYLIMDGRTTKTSLDKIIFLGLSVAYNEYL